MINNLTIKSKHFLIKPKEKTKGGIFIPENADAIVDSIMNEPQLVVHTGPEMDFVADGDYVIIESHQIRPMKVDGVHYFIIPEYRVDGKVIGYKPQEKEDKPDSPIISL